ncbi:hypothetical protein BS17DRAFT_772191, partial [Gyrodon lividus]
MCPCQVSGPRLALVASWASRAVSSHVVLSGWNIRSWALPRDKTIHGLIGLSLCLRLRGPCYYPPSNDFLVLVASGALEAPEQTL